jgi:hypothetical protein
MNTAEKLPCFGTQDDIAKSAKAVLIRRIARLVRQEGLDYEGWRYISKKVRMLWQLGEEAKWRPVRRNVHRGVGGGLVWHRGLLASSRTEAQRSSL